MGLPALVLLLLALPSMGAGQKLVLDVETFARKLRAVTEAEGAILDAFDSLDANIDALFALGAPIGDLLSASFNATWKEKSEEEMALAILHRDLKMWASDTDARYRSFRNNTKLGKAYWKSLLFDGIGIRVTTRNVNSLIALADPRRTNSSTISEDEMLKRCDNDQRPFLQYTLSDSWKCVEPSTASIQPFLRAQLAFRRIESDFPADEENTDADYSSLKHDILACMSSGAKRDTLIAAIESVDATTPQTTLKQLQGLQSVLNDCSSSSPDVHRTCLQEWFTMADEFNRTTRSQLLRVLHDNFIKSAVLEIACSRMQMVTPRFAEFGEAHYGHDRSAHLEQLRRVARTLHDWYRKSAETSFPEVGIEAAIRTIACRSSALLADNASAAAVKEIFESVGEDSYELRVLTAAARERNVSWSAWTTTASERSHAHLTHDDVDVHVFRAERHAASANRSIAASAWLVERRARIEAAIRNVSSSDTYTVARVLNGDLEIGPLVHKGLYRSVLLLRGKAFFSANARITVGQSGQTSSELVEVCTNGFFAYCWRVYFFL